ncbi:hypothetical protein [Fodinicola acaciae]|uniref:hypothetical protein n=1 Tax=Fodinicola acaciae TaxID=2681555 RepID=UPI0013D575FB|nr:hypothetical protein [Fodinicola acaciae]
MVRTIYERVARAERPRYWHAQIEARIGLGPSPPRPPPVGTALLLATAGGYCTKQADILTAIAVAPR